MLWTIQHYVHQGGRSFANSVRRKVWTQAKILSPNICYFPAILRFVAIYTLFERFWAKKAPDENSSHHFCIRRKAAKFCHRVYI